MRRIHLLTSPNFVLFSLLLYAEGNPALILSTKYLRIRCLSLIPQMISYVCFSAFRGMMGRLIIR
jgi:Na+-driven multidrug efflux pump